MVSETFCFQKQFIQKTGSSRLGTLQELRIKCFDRRVLVFGRCMMNKENKTWVQQTVLDCLFFKFLSREKNGPFLSQVLGRWTFFGSGFGL